MNAENRDEDVPETARRLGLDPHPEGGWYRRTYASGAEVDTENGRRPLATLIHFLLPPGETSAWHVVSSDEVWLWHGPGPLELQLGGTDDAPDQDGPVIAIGSGPGRRMQGLVPAGTWQRTLPGPTEVLVSCLVSPGFSFDDWRLADGTA